ncbi:hypothetical protein ACQPZA_11820 [Pseudonocardia xinjiangensis]|uniref:hypothetical protein n=1 Tax=Pseudonocardia xinjiangensis TaxID=75289 RepID=UPI003D8AFA81
MPVVAWVTIVIAALIIAVTAVGLLRVILHLRHMHTTLGALLGGVRTVADRTRTVPEGGAVGEREPRPRAGLDRDGVRSEL